MSAACARPPVPRDKQCALPCGCVQSVRSCDSMWDARQQYPHMLSPPLMLPMATLRVLTVLEIRHQSRDAPAKVRCRASIVGLVFRRRRATLVPARLSESRSRPLSRVAEFPPQTRALIGSRFLQPHRRFSPCWTSIQTQSFGRRRDQIRLAEIGAVDEVPSSRDQRHCQRHTCDCESMKMYESSSSISKWSRPAARRSCSGRGGFTT
jgi:hypothetical protein